MEKERGARRPSEITGNESLGDSESLSLESVCSQVIVVRVRESFSTSSRPGVIELANSVDHKVLAYSRVDGETWRNTSWGCGEDLGNSLPSPQTGFPGVAFCCIRYNSRACLDHVGHAKTIGRGLLH